MFGRLFGFSKFGLASLGAKIWVDELNDLIPAGFRNHRASSNSYDGTRTHTTGPMGYNGERERERRMRQIAAGSLRVENGLAL